MLCYTSLKAVTGAFVLVCSRFTFTQFKLVCKGENAKNDHPQNNYQDSINLMLLTNEVNALEGVNKSAVMMGTDANKDIFRNSDSNRGS